MQSEDNEPAIHAPNGNQWQSISGNHWQSLAISGNQRPSTHPTARCHPSGEKLRHVGDERSRRAAWSLCGESDQTLTAPSSPADANRGNRGCSARDGMERQRASSRPSQRASPASPPAAPNDICAAAADGSAPGTTPSRWAEPVAAAASGKAVGGGRSIPP